MSGYNDDGVNKNEIIDVYANMGALEDRVKVLEVRERENAKRRRNMKYTTVIGFLLGFLVAMFWAKQTTLPDLSWSWIIVPSLLLIITIVFWKRRRIND